MPPSNGQPNADRSPVPGSITRGTANGGERDRLDAAREHARKKILDRLIQQAMEDLQDPSVIESMPIDVEGEAARLAPAVLDAVKHRLMDRIASDVVDLISKGDAFRDVVDEATRRTEARLSEITEKVVVEVTNHLGTRVAERLTDTEALANRIEENVDKDSEQLTDVAHVVCGRIEESVRQKALDMVGNADVTAELVHKRIPEDHPALEAIVSILGARVSGDIGARVMAQFDDTEAAATKALAEVDRDAESLDRVRELLSEQLLVMVMGDALDDLGRKLASSGPRDSMLDRVFQKLTGPEQAQSTASFSTLSEPEEPTLPGSAEPSPEPESAYGAPSDPEPESARAESAPDTAETPAPESIEAIVSELEYEPVGVDAEPQGDAPSSAGTHCYVYGVVRTGDHSDPDFDLPDGVEEGSVIRWVERGKLTAAVSDVPAGTYSGTRPDQDRRGADWTRARLRRHARVLGQIGHRITVLPLPFGTTFASDADVSAMLAERSRDYVATLERLAGRVEWTVRMVRDDYRMLERMVDLLDADGMDLSSLPDDVAAELDAALAECEEPGRMMSVVTSQCVLHARAHLELYADASVDRRSAGGDAEDPTVLNRAYLVPRDGAGSFRKALETLAAQWSGLGVGFEVSGPWPPYHFAEGSFEA